MQFNAGNNPQNCPFPWGIHALTYHVVSWAHPNLQPKRHYDRISSLSTCLQLTVNCPLVYGEVENVHEIPPSPGDPGQHPTHASLGPPESSSQTACWLGQPSLYGSPYSFPIFYHVTGHVPPKLPLTPGGSGPHLIHGFLDPPKSTTQMVFRLVQPLLWGPCLLQTNRQTHRACYIDSNRSHLMLCIETWPKKWTCCQWSGCRSVCPFHISIRHFLPVNLKLTYGVDHYWSC